MQKITKRILCILMTAVMLTTAVIPSFAAENFVWDAIFESDDSKAGLIMFPGSDETERNFTWYTETENTPLLTLSTNNHMCGAEDFEGTTEKASDGDFVNHVTVTDLEYDTTFYFKASSGDYESAV